MLELNAGLALFLAIVLVMTMMAVVVLKTNGWKWVGGAAVAVFTLWWLGQLDVKDLGNDTTAIYNPAKGVPLSSKEEMERLQRRLDRYK